MAENTDKVLMGARGWLHPGWQDNFYPDDLPTDWQLAYYANEFPMVVIREQEWRQIDDMADLAKECRDDFQFLVEWPVSAATENVSDRIDKIRQLGRQCTGVIIQAGPTQAQQLTHCRSMLPDTIPCYSEGESDDIIKVPDGTSLKELRVVMESALLVSASSTAWVIIDGEPPDIELLRNAETLLGLL